MDSAGNQIKWKTPGSFWPMIAGIASSEQTSRLVDHLKDSLSFWRKIPFPTLAADQEGYSSSGNYWHGGVWAPANYMVIKGLEKYGYDAIATLASLKYLEGMHRVFVETGTVWENYMPDLFKPGDPSRPDFVGWTGVGPISLLIENVLGIGIDAPSKKVIWNINQKNDHGIEQLKLGDISIDLLFSPNNGSPNGR